MTGRRAEGNPEQLIRSGIRAVFGESAPIETCAFHSRSLFDLYRVRVRERDSKGLLEIAAKIVASPDMARTECEGLRALAATGVPVPACHGFWPNSESTTPSPGAKPAMAVLFMDFVSASGPRGNSAGSPGAAEQLVEDLLRLYASPGAEVQYGWEHSNFIGSLVQRNHRHQRFADFFWQDRLGAQFRAAESRGLLDAAIGRELEAVHLRCVEAWNLNDCGPRLIHGDLWGGNLLAGSEGRLHLIDPSVAYANPEQDLAMLDLFGSPLRGPQLERIAASVGAGPGLSKRIPYWQLYPLLVHVNIFGGGYISQLRAALKVYR